MNQLDQKISGYGKKAILGRERRAKQNLDELSSCVGGVFWGAEKEVWPSYNEAPLIPLLSLRTDELPYAPKNLRRVALLNVFVDAEESMLDADAGSIVIRAYRSISKLRPLLRPKGLKANHYRVEWKEVVDYPHDYHLSSCDRLDDEELEEYNDNIKRYQKKFRNHDGLKLDGWPTLVQETAFLMEGDPDYTLQMDVNNVYHYCDSGIGYLLKCKGKWCAHWETM